MILNSMPSALASNTTASFQWLGPASADGTLSFQEWGRDCFGGWDAIFCTIYFNSTTLSLSNCASSKHCPNLSTSAKPTSWRKWQWRYIVHSQPLALWLTFTSLPSSSLIPLPSIISQAWLKSSFHQRLGLAVYHSNDEPKLIWTVFLFSLLE